MSPILKTALILAGCAFIISLVYTKLPPGMLPSQRGEVEHVAEKEIGNTVQVAGQTIRVDIADSPEEREQGLSGKEGLAENEGMLFVFEEDGRYGFWMKDMLFSIDIIWLSKEGRIVDVLENAAPESYPEYSFLPNVAARYVLELPAGFAKTYNVKIGDWIEMEGHPTPTGTR